MRRTRRVAEKDRIRVARACAACRGRKVRCVPRPKGSCQRCEANGCTCVFEDIPETWSSSSRSTGRKLSQDMVWQANDQRDPATAEDEVRILGSFAASPADSDYPNVETASSRESDDNTSYAIQQYQSGKTSSQKKPASGELEGAVLLVEEPGRTQYTGLRSNESFLLCVKEVLEDEKDDRAAYTLVIKKPNETISRLQPVQSKELRQALEEFPPHSIATFLVSTFFYYVEATFCYCDREWFMEILNSIYVGNTSLSEVDEAFVCFALLVFAFGSQFAHLRSNTTMQDPLPTVSDPGRRFYDVSQTLIPRVISKCTLKGIQVCLLVGLYNLPSNLPDTSYLYLGIAMRMSIASGLHRKTSIVGLEERLMEVRHRLWWSLYCIDRRTSIALGRPASIAEEDIDAPFPKYHHSLDKMEYQSNFQHQIEYIKLTKIVNEIMRNIPLEAKPSSIANLSTKLKQWRSQLFSNLSPNDLLPNERNFRTTIHLQVHYHWAWIRMGRASLLQLLRERIQAALGKSDMKETQPESRQDLTNLCVDAAKATIQLILVLKQHNLLCRFSFTDHQPTTSAIIILILDSILQQCADTESIIENGVQTLRFMAIGGCRGAKSDLQTVEQLRIFATTLRQRIYQNGAIVQVSTPSPSSNDDYGSWVKWMSEKEGSASTQQLADAYEQPGGNTLDYGTEQPSSMLPLDPHTILDLSYSSTRGDDGYDNGSTFGFEWDHGRLDMMDVTQMLTGQSNTYYAPDSSFQP